MKIIHPVLFRYILIFFLFAFLIILLFIPVYLYISDFTLKNELSLLINKLHNGVDIVDFTINNINNTAFILRTDQRYSIFKSEPHVLRDYTGINPYHLTQLRNTFQILTLPHSIMTDTGVIFSKDVVLTPDRMFCYSRYYHFYDQFLSCGNYSYDEWLGLLNSKNSYIPAQTYTSSDHGTYEAITFEIHWPGSSYLDDNTFFSTMSINKLLPLLSDPVITEQGLIKIYDIMGNLLYEKNNNTPGKYHIISEESLTSQLRFEIGIPDSIIQKQIAHVRNLILFFSFLVSTIIISLSLIFGWHSYTPVHRFLTRINGTNNILSETEKEEQWDFKKSLGRFYQDLANAISTIDVKFEKSLQIINHQTELLRSQTLEKALGKGIYDIKEKDEFLMLFPDFPGKYIIGVIRNEPQENISLEERLTAHFLLLGLVRTKFNNIYIQSIEGEFIILVLPVNNDNSQSWNSSMLEFQDILYKQHNLVIHFLLSDVYENPQDLPKIWQQLQYFHVIPVPVQQPPFSIHSMELLYNTLRNANITGALLILHECSSRLPEPEDPVLSELTWNMLFNVVVQLKIEYPEMLGSISVPVFIKRQQQLLFEKQFPECFRLICEKIRNMKDKNESKLGKQIYAYINENLFDQNFYLPMVADHFKISPPTLQKLIKNITGQTFLSYVEKQRLTKARELLSTGEYSVNEVSKQCGFGNTNSFYKAFKRIYGFTPGVIRSDKN